jgi:multiple sugar transport system substrate-binding protein
MGNADALAGARLQKGEWEASRAGNLEFRDSPASLDDASQLDVLIFSADRMGDLVEAEVLATLPREAILAAPEQGSVSSIQEDSEQDEARRDSDPVRTFDYTDIAPVYRDQVSKYGTDLLGLPYGGTALVLVYRRDALTRKENLEAARTAGVSLEPPLTWTQLDAIAGFFQGRDWDGDGRNDHGIALAIADDEEGVANATFLARAASLGQHPDHFSFLFDADSMEPRIEAPPFVEALQGILALKSAAPTDPESLTLSGARKAFREGRVALLIDRAERASTWSPGKPVGVAPLPGSHRVYEPSQKAWQNLESRNNPSYLPQGGGWLIGVNRSLSGKEREAAIDLARFLADPENSNRIRTEPKFPILPFRTSQMSLGLPDPTESPDVDPRLWSDAISQTLMAARLIPGLRLPEAEGYLSDLAQGRKAALKGEAPEAALRSVAENWTQRTQKLGVRRQTWHYRRSLNTLATLPEPPPRGQ